MDASFAPALIAGVERVTAWADLLDEINVFPVADGDTGRNLVVSIAPLRRIALGREQTVRELLLSARGNSGNIAARFFSGLLMADALENIAEAIRQGRDRAWQAVLDPRPGTMLTVFDALVTAMAEKPAAYDAGWKRPSAPPRSFSPGSRRPASSMPGPSGSSSSWTDFSLRSW
jgi:dihydroxyacetone kinase-like predicted kinase